MSGREAAVMVMLGVAVLSVVRAWLAPSAAAASAPDRPRVHVFAEYGVVCFTNNVTSRAAVSISCVKVRDP
jgi:hypothetical protein